MGHYHRRIKIVGNEYTLYAGGAVYKSGNLDCKHIKQSDCAVIFEASRSFRGMKGKKLLDEIIEHYPSAKSANLINNLRVI